MLGYSLNTERYNQRNSNSPAEDLAIPEYLTDSKQHCRGKKGKSCAPPVQVFCLPAPCIVLCLPFFSYIIFPDEKKNNQDLIYAIIRHANSAHFSPHASKMGNWWQSMLPSVLLHFACWFSLGLHCWPCSCDALRENIAALASSDALSMIYHLTPRQHAHIRSLPFFFLAVHQSVFRSADLLGFPWFWQALKIDPLCLTVTAQPPICSHPVNNSRRKSSAKTARRVCECQFQRG